MFPFGCLALHSSGLPLCSRTLSLHPGEVLGCSCRNGYDVPADSLKPDDNKEIGKSCLPLHAFWCTSVLPLQSRLQCSGTLVGKQRTYCAANLSALEKTYSYLTLCQGTMSFLFS